MGITKSNIQKYIHALKGKHTTVRSRAAYALGEIGPDARAFVPALIKSLNDEEKEVRKAVVNALNRIEGKELATWLP